MRGLSFMMLVAQVLFDVYGSLWRFVSSSRKRIGKLFPITFLLLLYFDPPLHFLLLVPVLEICFAVYWSSPVAGGVSLYQIGLLW